MNNEQLTINNYISAKVGVIINFLGKYSPVSPVSPVSPHLLVSPSPVSQHIQLLVTMLRGTKPDILLNRTVYAQIK